MYLLDATEIRSPYEFYETNNKQMAQNRTLDGAVNRDFFGSNKRVWVLDYRNTNVTDFNVIKAKYDAYQANGATMTWQVTDTNYSVSSTMVHVDLVERSFSIRGTSYISDFTLTLTEA